VADSDRVAELKRKMQEKAQQVKAEAAAKESAPPAKSAAPAKSAPPAPAAAPAAVAAAAAVAAPAPVSAAPAAVAAPSKNGAAPQAASDAYVEPQLSPEELARREMNRREFLTYAWGGALGLVGLASGVGLFQFMYPRFRAGEFGGKFFIGPVSAMPATDAPPQPDSAGKFWLVNTEDEGVKAIYMVCTHLGCLYKWEASTVRFECPCHGSKFTREGLYIEGPAPRSLDLFEVLEEDGQIVVDTGSKITGGPAGESPARIVV